MTTIPDAISLYEAGGRILRESVAGLSREHLLARPVPGKWSALEVVAHLADFEPVYVDRIKRVVALDNPSLLDADENLYAAALDYHGRDIDEELAVVEALRVSTARTLRGLPESAFARPGVHSARGPLTLLSLMQYATNHVAHHVRFIADKRRALGL